MHMATKTLGTVRHQQASFDGVLRIQTPWIYGAVIVDCIDLSITMRSPIRRPFHCGLSFKRHSICTSSRKKFVTWVVYLEPKFNIEGNTAGSIVEFVSESSKLGPFWLSTK